DREAAGVPGRRSRPRSVRCAGGARRLGRGGGGGVRGGGGHRDDRRAHARRGAARRPHAGRGRTGGHRGDRRHPSRREVPGSLRVGCGRGRDRRDPGRSPGIRDEDHLGAGAGGGRPAGGGGRRGVLAPPRRVRARRLRRRLPGTGRPRARPAHRPGEGGAAPPGPRLLVQGDRPSAGHLDQDGGDPRLRRAAQAAADQPAPAQPVGHRPPSGL
ncbi:MAG: Two-component transcriptional response regulator, LuxR family, partial [uncultured Acidimicrobiales bacterium]